MKTQPDWVNKDLYPFTSRWIDIDGQKLHYVDEGQGEIILFVHGTPEWSFGYRDLIKGLRQNFRCIAMDYLGFGLSDKPQDGNYSCAGHSARLTKFIERLALRNVNIVANDFGGGISMGYALGHAGNINKVILFNTWMWSLKGDAHYSFPARIMNSWLGKFLYLQMNFPVNTIMPSAYGDKRKLTKEIHDHYRRPVPDAKTRVGLYAFSKELMSSSDWWQSLWTQLDRLSSDRFMIFWGLKDKFVPSYELEKWKLKLPDAQIITFNDAGHFVQEEKPNEMVTAIRKFMSKGRVGTQKSGARSQE